MPKDTPITIEDISKQHTAGLPFISLAKAQEALDCSRSFLYKLIDEGKLKPRYLGKKPYLMIANILEIMTEKPISI
jgi:hypothetical protein